MDELGQDDSAPSGEQRTTDGDEADADMIVLDEIDAEIDDVDLLAEDILDQEERGGSNATDQIHEEIELSSDEEPDTTDDVSLVLLRRPPAIEPQEAIDILDSDEEFPVYITESAKQENINILEKNGRVAEYIESEGLGMIYAEDYGLVLFHLSHVWIDGKQLSLARTRERLEAGAEVKFYDQTLTGPQYSGLSRENILHQALVVWSGERPRHLMKNMDQVGAEYMEELTAHREMFMVYVDGQVFIPCELARVKGVVIGYINDSMGVIECKDEDRNCVKVLFSAHDVLVFQKPLLMWAEQYRSPPGRLLPLGLYVSVDARKVSGVGDIQYQAILVLAGSWPPSANMLSALPGGPGSYSQTYNVPEDHTFYYLELSRDAGLARNLEKLKEELGRTEGEIIFTRRNTDEVRDAEDREVWRQQFTDKPKRPRGRGQENRDVKSVFRAPPATFFKGKRELEDGSSVVSVSGGNSVVGGSVVSRAGSGVSQTSSCWSTRSGRDWYNPAYWRHGGLRIKEEIKTENDMMDGEPQAKRMKMEK